MLLIPILFPIYVNLIGGSISAGDHFPSVRIIKTYLGLPVIPIWQEFLFVARGTIAGRTAFSILLWIGGLVFLAAAAALILSNRGERRQNVKVYGLGCALLVISTMLQYGPFFNGPAGVAIPIGLPLLVVIGYFLWKDATHADSVEEYDDDFDEPDGLTCAEPLAGTPGADLGADD